MVTELEQLARRAVACKHWRWMPGMLAVHHEGYGNNGLDGRIIEIDDTKGPMWIGWGDIYLPLLEGSLPDLSDPATVGCLLALVREITGKPYLFSSNQEEYWGIADGDDNYLSHFWRTEVAAWGEVLVNLP